MLLFILQKYFFKQRPEAEGTKYGDISDRIALRKRLGCKSFDWYLKNVYPEQVSIYLERLCVLGMVELGAIFNVCRMYHLYGMFDCEGLGGLRKEVSFQSVECVILV